jgi:hypothetical protein
LRSYARRRSVYGGGNLSLDLDLDLKPTLSLNLKLSLDLNLDLNLVLRLYFWEGIVKYFARILKINILLYI